MPPANFNLSGFQRQTGMVSPVQVLAIADELSYRESGQTGRAADPTTLVQELVKPSGDRLLCWEVLTAGN